MNPFDFIQKASGFNPTATRILIIVPLACAAFAIGYSFIDENPQKMLVFSVLAVIGIAIIMALSALKNNDTIGKHGDILIQTVIYVFCAVIVVFFLSWSTHCPRPLRCLLDPTEDCPPRPACMMTELMGMKMAMQVDGPSLTPQSPLNGPPASSAQPINPPRMSPVIVRPPAATPNVVPTPPPPPPLVDRSQFTFYIQFDGYARDKVVEAEQSIIAKGWRQRFKPERTSNAKGVNELRISSRQQQPAATQFITDLRASGLLANNDFNIKVFPDVSPNSIEVWLSQ
jgi:hypothetical protein